MSKGRLDLPIGALCSIVVGGVLYLLWRADSLLMFYWADILGVGNSLDVARQLVRSAGTQPPEWATLSLPAALWAYSLTVLLGWIWAENWVVVCGLVVPAMVVLAAGVEVGQAVGVVPGTYTTLDLVLGVAAVFVGLIHYSGSEWEVGHEVDEGRAQRSRGRLLRSTGVGEY